MTLVLVNPQEQQEVVLREHQEQQSEVQLHQLYAVDASMLSNEPVDEQDTGDLRTDGSAHGVCYMQLTRNLGNGTYIAKVAAHPLLVSSGYIIVVTAKQLLRASLYQ